MRFAHKCSAGTRLGNVTNLAERRLEAGNGEQSRTNDTCVQGIRYVLISTISEGLFFCFGAGIVIYESIRIPRDIPQNTIVILFLES